MYFTQLILLATVTHAANNCPRCDSQEYQQQQCPCVRTPGTTECIQYDPSHFATSIDEAMFNFPNPTTGGKPLFDKNPEPPQGGFAPYAAAAAVPTTNRMQVEQSVADDLPPKLDPVGSCTSTDCVTCKLTIMEGFIDNSPAATQNDTMFLAARDLKQQTGLDAGGCQTSQGVATGESGGNFSPEPMETTTERISDKQRKENEKKINQLISLLTQTNQKKQRRRRDSSADQLLGITNQIGCDYQKGTVLSTDENWCGLCNLCWQWRRLPDEYFPNYVNEVSCDTKDNACLAGFGKCRPVLRVLNVLKNHGTKENPQWEQASIESNAACECQVEMNTPIYSLVTKWEQASIESNAACECQVEVGTPLHTLVSK